MFLTGVLGNPLLILPPITFMQKYLHRIPVLGAVFFTAFITLGFLLTLGAMQGDIRQVGPVNIPWLSMKTILTDLFVASVAAVLSCGWTTWSPIPKKHMSRALQRVNDSGRNKEKKGIIPTHQIRAALHRPGSITCRAETEKPQLLFLHSRDLLHRF